MTELRPEWMPRPACRVVLVCGPSGAGKTTWATAAAQASDVVIDLDDCFTQACGVHGHEASRDYLTAALAIRNCRIAALSLKDSGTAYVIMTLPRSEDRAWWASKLGAEVRMIAPSMDVIRGRDITDQRIRQAEEWYRLYERDELIEAIKSMATAG